ncbi:MAG TPA: hypothetical protein VFJ90_17125, partial [Candidatus Didemnitutus sp.]|nr:hypothetical protein [Candidatus Didemnitutus sp.]
ARRAPTPTNAQPDFPGAVWLAAAVYGLFVYLLMPRAVFALSDDFAYLRSVVLTLQHGRPWTDEWLEPWNAGFASLSAVVFWITKNFHFATYGLLGILAGTFFFGVCRLLQSRGLATWTAIALAGIGLTFPTMFWKTVDFTGVALYAPCLVLALGAAEKRRWGWFLVWWALALSTRQSALVWGVLPLAAYYEDWRTDQRTGRAWFLPVFVVTVGALLFRGLASSMNETMAQRAITGRAWELWDWRTAASGWAIGAVVLLVALGLAAIVARFVVSGKTTARAWPKPLLAVGLVAVAVLLWMKPGDFISFEHAGFESIAGALDLKLVVLLAGTGLLLGRFAFRPVPLAGALAAVAVLGARSLIWDYYLLEVAVFGFFAMEANSDGREPAGSWRLAWLAPAALLVGLNATAIVRFKAEMDRCHAVCALGSEALESGRLPPDEASFLPFGLMAWYYFPLYLQHDGAGGKDPADFGRYLKQDTVAIAWRFSKPLRGLHDHDGDLPADRSAEIIEGKFNYCWFYGAEVVLLRNPSSQVRPAKSPYPGGYALPPFPRDNAGWRALIEQRRARE